MSDPCPKFGHFSNRLVARALESARDVIAVDYAQSMSNRRSLPASPLTRVALAHLFEALERELSRLSCDNTLRLTARWLSDHDNDIASAYVWLRRLGGYCDCEVLLNVEPKIFEAS